MLMHIPSTLPVAVLLIADKYTEIALSVVPLYIFAHMTTVDPSIPKFVL